MSEKNICFDMNALAYAYGKPAVTATLKSSPEDFRVEEQIAFSLLGEGEHLWIWVEKTGQNTDWVAKQIASYIGITSREMGVAGKKDRHAITYQWMSCHLPGKPDPDFLKLSIPGVRVLKAVRHNRKLQTGGLSGNRFQITLNNVEGGLEQIEERLKAIQVHGVPNYFGEQRFGNDMQNLAQASRLFNGEIKPKRHQKSLYLSAARSWMFNEELSERIQQNTWNQAIEGDVFQLQGSQKCFVSEVDVEIQQRVTELDIHPTGSLTGRGKSLATAKVYELEQSIMANYPLWQTGLEKFGLKQERRALRVLPQDLSWQLEGVAEGGVADELQDGLEFTQTRLVLSFTLPAGSYATMLVREVALVTSELV
ncbi:tRNA pseudouridine(13) synthase TruD [Hydrogenovibrio kuenenii]|uniref:tRNA pseudouridine(13) synthase TruD n=1 Tax=Hydrogenovibrio kuenenii TaxID=63658 RepID=UPI0004638197|nr:tRNA pseudouridine(13) synthase TruD [Hydrogenovibrio kuenenii]